MRLSKGFTLIELLLVISLLAISVGLTTDILLSLVRSYGKTQIINDIEQNANFVSVKLEKELRSANSVNLISSDELTIVKDAETVTYRVQANKIQRKINSGGYADLTKDLEPSGVAVTCPAECFSVSGTSPAIVTYTFVFSQPSSISGTSFNGSVNVRSTVVIRNSYR